MSTILFDKKLKLSYFFSFSFLSPYQESGDAAQFVHGLVQPSFEALTCIVGMGRFDIDFNFNSTVKALPATILVSDQLYDHRCEIPFELSLKLKNQKLS